MAVTSTDRKVTAVCDGVATEFPFNFPIRDDTDIHVLLRNTTTGEETDLVSGINFEIENAATTDWASASGGEVNTIAAGVPYAYPAGYEIVIYRVTPKVQESIYLSGKTFSAATLRENLDNLTMMVQELSEMLDRALVAPISDLVADFSLPPAEDRINTFLAFDATGKPVATMYTPDGLGNVLFKSLFTAEGVLLVGSGAGTVLSLPVGADGLVLTANSAVAGGVEWVASAAGLVNPMTSPGDMIYGGAAGIPTRLAPVAAARGLIETVLADGVEWAASLQSTMTTAGDLIYCFTSGNPGVSHPVVARLAKGTSRQALLMNLAATYPQWGNAVLDEDYTAKGVILSGSGAGTFAVLGIGADAQVLTADSGSPGGVKWGAAAGGGITQAEAIMWAVAL
jgi:hypothetical protein